MFRMVTGTNKTTENMFGGRTGTWKWKTSKERGSKENS